MEVLRRNHFLLNPFKENITIFSIADGETIEEGDFVVVNTGTLQASKPKKEGGYFAVGRAIKIIEDVSKTTWVICKDGIFKCANSKNYEYSVLKDDVCRVCYFEDSETVCINNINSTKAGEIISCMDDGVLIRINVTEGSGLEW